MAIFPLLTGFSAHAQQTDTLRVLVLSPYRVDICKECRAEYEARNHAIVENRKLAAEAKRREKQANTAQYNQQPEYTRRMFENDGAFIDSLTLGNYVAYVAREFIAHRLYRPYKIKPRLIFVTTQRLASSPTNYATTAKATKADFILNFPLIAVEKSNQGMKVTTSTELYSSEKKATILKGESTGTIAGDGATDYPMCARGQLDCAFVNSVYENVYKSILIIAESRK